MSKERKLLERWFDEFGKIHADIKLLRDTQTLLAQPEQSNEPVAWMWTRKYEGGGYTAKLFQLLCDAEEYAKDSQNLKRPDIITPLYTSPPTRKPLSDSILSKEVDIIKKDADFSNVRPWQIYYLMRKTEELHGIGVDDEK